MNNFFLANDKRADTPLDSFFHGKISEFIHNFDFKEKKSDYQTHIKPFLWQKSDYKLPNS